METSRERVLKTINHIQPDVIPVRLMGPAKLKDWQEYLDATDYFDLFDKLGLDFVEIRPIYTGPNAERGLSIWGTDFSYSGYKGSGYSKVHRDPPLADATSVADVEHFAWPDPDEFDFSSAAALLKTISEKARMIRVHYAIKQPGVTGEDLLRGRLPPDREGVVNEWVPVICTLFNLFGLEETLIKLHTEPRLIECAVDHIDAFLMTFCRRLLEATRGLAEIFWYGDDFATQIGLILSPDHWRRFLKPTYKRLFDLAKSYDLKVWFHSCGTFRPVMPDLVDIGMDVWETVQAHLPGNEPEVLKREYGEDIAFYGAINTQSTLPFGSSDDVRAEVRKRIQVLGKGGGYICGSDHSILPDVPADNVLAMIDEAKSYRF